MPVLLMLLDIVTLSRCHVVSLRCVLLAADPLRPTLEERQKLAGAVHAWRLQYNADNMLQQANPHFKWFKQHLDLKLLTTTPQGYVVVLIKVCAVSHSVLCFTVGLSQIARPQLDMVRACH